MQLSELNPGDRFVPDDAKYHEIQAKRKELLGDESTVEYRVLDLTKSVIFIDNHAQAHAGFHSVAEALRRHWGTDFVLASGSDGALHPFRKDSEVRHLS